MKKYIENHWWQLILFIVVFVIGIPFFILKGLSLINSENLYLTDELKTGDVLAYYGMLLAAFIAIYGVHLTMTQTQQNYLDDTRYKVLPFFSIEILNTIAKFDLLDIDIDDEISETEKLIKYEEYSIDNLIFIIDSGGIKNQRYFTNEQKKVISTGERIIQKGAVRSYHIAKHINVPISIKNVGNGPAISLRIGLNPSCVHSEKREYTKPVPAEVGRNFDIHIFSEHFLEDSNCCGEYVLELKYFDIFGNHYRQQQYINIKIDDVKKNPICYFFTKQEQELL